MIITMKGVQVGVLYPDGVIEFQAPELRSLNEYWQTNGIFTTGGLAHYLDTRYINQHAGNTHPHEIVVVDHQHLDQGST